MSNDVRASGQGPRADDDSALLGELAAMWEQRDPMPAGLVERVLVALATEDLDTEYELLHLVSRTDELTGARGGGDALTISFSGESFALLLRVSGIERLLTPRRRLGHAGPRDAGDREAAAEDVGGRRGRLRSVRATAPAGRPVTLLVGRCAVVRVRRGPGALRDTDLRAVEENRCRTKPTAPAPPARARTPPPQRQPLPLRPRPQPAVQAHATERRGQAARPGDGDQRSRRLPAPDRVRRAAADRVGVPRPRRGPAHAA